MQAALAYTALATRALRAPGAEADRHGVELAHAELERLIGLLVQQDT